jgi:hypothetical protein
MKIKIDIPCTKTFHLNLHTHTQTHTSMYVCMYVCMCIYIYIFIYKTLTELQLTIIFSKFAFRL